VPAFGYKTYRIVDGVSAGTSPGPTHRRNPRASGTTLENEFYTILPSIPRAARSPASAIAQLDRELLDPAAPYQFNQPVLDQRRSSRRVASKAPTTRHATAPETRPQAPARWPRRSIATLPRRRNSAAPRITQTVRLYAGVKRIDVVNELRHVGVLCTRHAAQ
jgi:hypothetical protein